MVQEEVGITEEMTGVVAGCISDGVWVQHYVHLRLELRRLEYVCYQGRLVRRGHATQYYTSENIEIFIVTKNSTFRYQSLLLCYLTCYDLNCTTL